MSAPRVLVVGTLLGQPFGGVRRHNAELLPRVARLLEQDGGSLAVLEGDARIAFELPPGVERLVARVPPGPPLARAFAEGRALARVLAQARECDRPFDRVHTAHLPVPRCGDTRCCLTLHDLRNLDPWFASTARRFAARSALASAARRVHTWITVSETVRGALLERLALDPARVHVVPNAPDHLQPLPRVAPALRTLLCVGHLEPRKNLELVLRALAAAPSLPALTLAGAGKRGEQVRLARLARELGIEGRVHFTGSFDDERLPALYAQAACVVLPSRIEGFGIAALEAQRARVPLCIARTPTLVEIAGSDVPSFALDDPLECARAIERASAATADELERAAQRAQRFSWEDSARRLVAAWR